MSVPSTFTSMFMGQGTSGVQYIGATNVYTGGGSRTYDVSAIAQPGDYLLFVYLFVYSTTNSDSMSSTVCSTSIFQTKYTNFGMGALGGFYSGTNPVVSANGTTGNSYYMGKVFVFRGVNTTTPIDVQDGTYQTSTVLNTSKSLNGITTTTEKTFVLWMFGSQQDTASTDLFDTWANTNLENTIELADHSSTLYVGMVLGMWGGNLQTAKATGATTFIPRYTNNSLSGYRIIALRAA